MSSKTIYVQIEPNILGEDRCIVIVERKNNFMTFRKTVQTVPFYYFHIRDIEEPYFHERMIEKRWYTGDVRKAVYSLL